MCVSASNPRLCELINGNRLKGCLVGEPVYPYFASLRLLNKGLQYSSSGFFAERSCAC
jgi:hypothetical protein